MFIDLPVPEFATTRGTSFSIGGWALDQSSSAGAGIEAIHVWAYPTSGAAPIFVGAYNGRRGAVGRRQRVWRAIRRLRVFFTGLFGGGRLQPCSFCAKCGRAPVQ